jgi:phosphoglycerol geranylgeranyltransferase
MPLGSLSPKLEHFLNSVRFGSQRLLDTNPLPDGWRHVTSVTPGDDGPLPLLYPLYVQHTDATFVADAGTPTGENVRTTIELLAYVPTPVVLESGVPETLSVEALAAADFLAVPGVLNGETSDLFAKLGGMIGRIETDIAPAVLDRSSPFPVPEGWREPLADLVASWLLADAVVEAEVLQNPDSERAQAAGATPLSPADARSLGRVADRYLESEILRVEDGNPDEETMAVLEELVETCSRSRIWASGDVRTRSGRRRLLESGADAVLVDDVFHEIAAEEARICRRASEELPAPATREAIGGWVESEVDADATAAAAYLATVPGIGDATGYAREYLTTTLTVWLDLQAVLADARESVETPEDLRQFVADRKYQELQSIELALRSVIPEVDRERYTRDLSRSVLAMQLGLDEPRPFPVERFPLAEGSADPEATGTGPGDETATG